MQVLPTGEDLGGAEIIIMKNISVIGAGTMGNGIAHVCAQFGYQVSLVDIAQSALDKAIATITKNLDRQVQKGAITEEVKQQTLIVSWQATPLLYLLQKLVPLPNVRTK